jgi:uncharacterized protein YprB with RNaseH-like and TPR domain
MDLRKKLERLREASRKVEAEPERPPASGAFDPEPPAALADDGRSLRIARLRTMIGQVVERDRRRSATHGARPGGKADWSGLPGQEVENEHGAMRVLDRWLEPDHCHGRVPVSSALEIRGETMAELALDPDLSGIGAGNMLILDTETTGLMGGTGAVAFLIGLGWFEQGVFRLEQLLLKGFGQEAPMLQRVAERLSQFSHLVTYNGKSFDWPLLRTRFVMNRIPPPPDPPHLDLLHCVRRVYKPRIKDVRLTDVEERILDFHREGDVDGSEIPELYLRFLRGDDRRLLLPVIEHNANDLIALAAIAGKVIRHFEAVQCSDDPRDHLAFARVASRASNRERALTFARAAVEGSGSDNVTVDALLLTAKLSRQSGDFAGSAGALNEALAASPDEQAAAFIHLSLAKLYEHRLRDLDLARHHARFSAEAEGDERNEKRLARIERKMEKARTAARQKCDGRP